jgi:ATP-binding cassette subfamily B protein
MDCGPAAQMHLEGFEFRSVMAGCNLQTDVVYPSILSKVLLYSWDCAEQVMLPADHLVLDEAQALPAIVVVRRPSGLTHFLVVWNRVGGLLQVMDPASGRRWPTWQKFQNELFIHTFPVPIEDWRLWAGSEGLILPLRRRMDDLRLRDALIDDLLDEALADAGWRSLATLGSHTQPSGAPARCWRGGQVLKRFYTLNCRRCRSRCRCAGLAVGGQVEKIWSSRPVTGQCCGGGKRRTTPG